MAQRTKSSLKRSSIGGPCLDRRDRKRELEEDLGSIYSQIGNIARRDARLEFGEKKNRIFLTNWWCTHYNRPLKDPLLKEYTLEELTYEYYLIGELEAYRSELAKSEDDKIEEAKMQKAEEWADMMEAEEEEERQRLEKEKQEKEKKEVPDPRNDPKQIEWMEEEIKKNKLLFGEDFGEDVNLNFGNED